MKYKPDWPEAQERLSALWHGEALDRPCISVRAPQPVDKEVVVPDPADAEARWLDPAYIIPAARRQLQGTWWGGESIPSSLLMAGWIVCVGGEPRFEPNTIWFETREVDFDQPSPFRHDPDSPWVKKYVTLLDALCEEAGVDDFLIGRPTLLPVNDLLSMHMGTEEFLLALMDEPGWMEKALHEAAADQLQAGRDLAERIRARHAFWYGNAGWMPFWAPEPYLATQSDVSCMLSPEMFDRFVLPELDLLGQEHGALWYHLDGGDARQHLPTLLAQDWLRVVQYVPAPCEPPNGPGHLPMYQQIQRAGKIVHVDVSLDHVEPLLRELDPGLLMLQTWCPSRDEGEALLEKSRSWM